MHKVYIEGNSRHLIDDVITPQAAGQPDRKLRLVDYKPFEELGRRLKKNKFLVNLRRPKMIEVESADEPATVPVRKIESHARIITRIPPLASSMMQLPAITPRPRVLQGIASSVLAALGSGFTASWTFIRGTARTGAARMSGLFANKGYTADEGVYRYWQPKALYGLAAILIIIGLASIVIDAPGHGPSGGASHGAGGLSGTAGSGQSAGENTISTGNVSARKPGPAAGSSQHAGTTSTSVGGGTASQPAAAPSSSLTGSSSPAFTTLPVTGGMGGGSLLPSPNPDPSLSGTPSTDSITPTNTITVPATGLNVEGKPLLESSGTSLMIN